MCAESQSGHKSEVRGTPKEALIKSVIPAKAGMTIYGLNQSFPNLLI